MKNYIERDEREELTYNSAMSKTMKSIFTLVFFLMLGSTIIDILNNKISIISVMLLFLLLLISIIIIINFHKMGINKVILKDPETIEKYLKNLKIMLFSLALIFAIIFNILTNVLPNYMSKKVIEFDFLNLFSDIIFGLIMAVVLYFIEKRRIIHE